MKSNYSELGEYIREVNERNSDLAITNLLGVSMEKTFIQSVANLNGVDMSVYKVLKNEQLACKLMSVGRDEKLPVDLYREQEPSIVSSAYYVFEPKDKEELLPEYLMMWLCRPENDRYIGFISGGDVRGGISWEIFCSLPIKVPSISKQREIVKEYNVIQTRITLNQELIRKLEEAAQAIYKQWFVEFEFPDESGKPYKSNGREMVFNEELEKEIPLGWEKCVLKDISKCLDFKRKPLSEEERNQFKGGFPYYGAMGIVDYVKEYIFDGEYLLFSEDGVNVIDAKGHPAIFLIWGKFWVNNHAHILEGKDGFSSRLIYSMLKEVNVSDLVTGAAQPKINQENMNSIILTKPDILVSKAFDRIINPMFDIIMNKSQENQKLTELKDLLLSKLTTIEN
jgi:type I restriction enzyme S subunit